MDLVSESPVRSVIELSINIDLMPLGNFAISINAYHEKVIAISNLSIFETRAIILEACERARQFDQTETVQATVSEAN